MITLRQPAGPIKAVSRGFKRWGILPRRQPTRIITHKEKTMKRPTKVTAFMVPLLLLVGPAPHFAATYEPQPIETMIDRSDLVVIGTVEKTSVYENEKGDARRETTIRIQEVIKGEDKDTGETIVVEHFEGAFESKGGEIEQYAYFRPIFTLGEQTLLLLLSRGDIYEVTGGFRGKIDIIGNKVAGIGTNVTDFKEAIKRVDRKEVSKLEVEMVPIEYQLNKVRAASGKRAAKIASVYGKHLDGQFHAYTYRRHHPPPLTITFHINPDGAIDGNGNPIPFSDLKTAMDACVAEWNRIEDGHARTSLGLRLRRIQALGPLFGKQIPDIQVYPKISGM